MNMFKLDEMLSRFFHTSSRQLMRRSRRSNPGAAYQIQELEHIDQLQHDPEGFGNVESDFMGAHKTHRQHEAEMLQERERIRHLMIKHKYFRDEKLPNLLTYAEKEQMRLLHQRDADEWTVERLAESFPATPEIVQKILRAKWRPRSVKRIKEHDEAVIRNWQQIRAGSSPELSAELMQHLQKFSERKDGDLQTAAQDWPTRPELPKPRTNEFSALITSCSKYAEQGQTENVALLKAGRKMNSTARPSDPEDETYLVDQVVDKRKMRLQDLKKLKLSEAELASSRHPPTETSTKSLEQLAIEAFGSPSGTGIIARTPSSSVTHSTSQHLATMDFVKKFQSSEIVISAEDRKRFEMSSVKDRVHIPRKLWRKGATYRMEDCYYDDDGEFLYRVPGMTGP